ncbi:MAG: PhoU family transcriptional regulator [Campylobacteraceae bacterium]|jgi:phosphate transport system protein|nr:PhoU family transcriptional regulator [Campylobacteraceae bacterium]
MLTHHEEKLENIRESVSDLAANITKSSNNILLGLETKDKNSFLEARTNLKNIENGANLIDNEIITSLALFGAEATDLRELVAYLKITNELVRIADNLKGFAKNISKYTEDENFSFYQDNAIQLCKTTASSIAYVALSFEKEQNIEDIYTKIKVEESKNDDLYSILQKNILSKITEDFDFTANFIEILSTMRKLEKTADRSVAVVKLMLFARGGGKLKLY